MKMELIHVLEIVLRDRPFDILGGGGAGFFSPDTGIFFTDKGKHDFFFCQHSKPFFFQVPLKLTFFITIEHYICIGFNTSFK